MNIASINQLNSLNQVSGIGNSAIAQTEGTTKDGYSFTSILTDAIDNVADTDAVVNQEAYKLATGQTDNLHDITIASTQAGLAVDLFVQLRNKTLAAYNEIMNINV